MSWIFKKKNHVFAFFLGFATIIIQTIILRVFQVVFYGNELSYAVLLSSWLFWVSFGSFLSTLIFSKVKVSFNLIIFSFVVLALSAPVIVFGARYIHPVLDVSPGEMIGIIPMVISAVLLSAPVSFIAGAIFVLLCSWTEEAGRVYFYEALGSAIGGALVSFFLVIFFTPVRSMLLMAFTILFVTFFMVNKSRSMKKFLSGLLCFIAIFVVIDFFMDLDFLSQRKQWPYGRLVSVEDSPYASLAVLEHEGELSFFQNGLLSFSTNDLLSAEENVHLPLLAHPDPRHVLFIGNGLGGEINQILKYPDIIVDYVEIDRKLLDMGRRYLRDEEAAVLDHSRVSVHYDDARHFVRNTQQEYDVVIVNVGDPLTAGINRFYTLEFMTELDRILKIGGIASFRVSSSENYISDENLIFLRSLFVTLKSVFPEARSIPGGMHTFLVSNLMDRITLDAEWFSARLIVSGVQNRFVNENSLPFILDERRIEHAEKLIIRGDGLINRDLFPRGYLLKILFWSTHFDTGFKKLAAAFKVPFWLLLFFLTGMLFVISFLKTRRNRLNGIDMAVMVTGFSEIVFQIIVILLFQSLYGIAYQKIGLILASFMLGLVLGSRRAVKMNTAASEKMLAVFRMLQLCIIVYPLLLPVVFVMFRDLKVAQPWADVLMVIFSLLPFIAGFLGGMQYPLAAFLKKKIGGETGVRSAGSLYALDVLGASIGAFFAGVFLIPLFGIVAVCVLCSSVSIVVYLFIPRD